MASECDRRGDIGYAVRTERERKGLTQREVGEALGLGRVQISNIEAGRRHLKAQEAAVLARLFGVGASWFCDPPKATSYRYTASSLDREIL